MSIHPAAPRDVLTLTPSEFAARSAAVLAWTIGTAVQRRGGCSIVLAGGRTPAAVYRLLSTMTGIPWMALEVFIGDERCVPPDDADSNFRMIADTLLRAVPIPDVQVHRLEGELGAAEAAARYERLLRARTAPMFDVVLSGIGADGHTASLFPGDPRLDSSPALVLPATAPPPFAVAERVGLSLRTLNSTRHQIVFCTGDDKRDVRDRILRGDTAAQALPAARLHGIERTLWITDSD